MIGDVNDARSGGMADAVMGALQRSARWVGICWRVADSFMIARFAGAERTRDAGHGESADKLCPGFG